MKRDLSLKSVVLFFLILVVLYLGSFYGWEHWQRRLGPWEVEFSGTNGHPVISINHPGLQIASVQLIFLEEQGAMTNSIQVVTFDQGHQQIPFGKVLYEDLRSMPGIVTFDFFGHEIELRPRLLVINRKELPWTSARTIALSPTNKVVEPLKSPNSSRD
jgi:hypothetical protein